jgi:hypothetical protein
MLILRYNNKIKVMYLSINSNYQSFNSQLAKEEKNDCVVRSLATATNVQYETAHKFAEDFFGRINKRGTSNISIAAQMLRFETTGIEIGNKKFTLRILGKREIKNLYKLKGEQIWRKKTLKSFIQGHQQGTYMVMVAGHALTVKDGEVLDWNSNKFLPTRKVQAAYELNLKQEMQLSLFE